MWLSRAISNYFNRQLKKLCENTILNTVASARCLKFITKVQALVVKILIINGYEPIYPHS